VAGFWHHRPLFERDLAVDEIWLAWTENPADHQARALGEKHEQAFQAVRSAVTRMQSLGADARANQLATQVEAVTGFFGGPASRLGFSKRTDEAMDLIRNRAPVEYREPGMTLTHPAIPQVRFYVLGPPRSQELFRSDPRKGEAYEEEAGAALDAERSLHQAFRVGLDPDSWTAADAELWEMSRPFDAPHEIPLDDARGHPWFQRHYYGGAGDAAAADQQWRRIDGSWLDGAAQLALQLDSDTNNSSLVLAIELLESGKVLLFPGDAQAGSWRSWGSVEFQVPTATGTKTVTGRDLLARTGFYKVGHHGSHNATLRGQGLELMSDDLVAMIPVDRAIAMKPKGGGHGWNMPFPPLERRLRQKTRGRLIRADEELPEKSPAGLPEGEWQEFRKSLRHGTDRFPTERESVERPIYVELTVTP
jgi:hypothetical protein